MIGVLQHYPTLPENLAMEPDGEGSVSGAVTYWWGNYAGPSRWWATDDFHSPTHSVRYTTVSAGTSAEGCVCRNVRLIYTGVWIAGAWVKAPAGVVLMAGLRLMGTSGSLLGETHRVTYTADGTWQWLTSTPSGLNMGSDPRRPCCVGFQVHTTTPFPPAGTQIYVDDVKVWRMDGG